MAMRLSGLNSGLDTDAMISSMTQGYQLKIDNIDKEKQSVQYKIDAWNNLNSKIYSFYSENLSKNRFKNSFSINNTKSSSDALTINSSDSFEGSHSAKVLSTAKVGYITGKKMENVSENSKVNSLGINNGTYKFNNKEIIIDDTTTISTLTKDLNKAGVKASFDKNQKRFFIMAEESGKENDLNLSSEATSSELADVLGVGTSYYLDDNGNYYNDKNMTNKIEDQSLIKDVKNGKYAVRIAGSDAEVLLDGASYKSTSNKMSVNGLNFTINNVSNENIEITTSKDISQALNQIKDFVKEYNNIMEAMNTAYHTDSDGYTPLSDSEKDVLSDRQLEKWEDKLTSSALYKDSALYSLMQKIRKNVSMGVENSNGETVFSSKFGVSTNAYLSSNTKDRYSLTIDENKLKKALEENADAVTEHFSSLANNLYKTIDVAMNSNKTMSSAYKVYNDKSLNSKLNSFDKEIVKLEEKMVSMEEKYYKQFSAMEKAFANLNSQNNFFSNFFNIRI